MQILPSACQRTDQSRNCARVSPLAWIALLLVLENSSVNLFAQSSTSGPIVAAGIYANHRAVAAALTKGALLINNPKTPAAIKVSGSHRVKVGVAEVREKQTEILYITDGEATLIAGGKRVKSNVIPYEIKGGETFRLTKGDIVVIPAGTPQWFREVPKSISYHLIQLNSSPGETGELTFIDHHKVAVALNSKGEIFSSSKLRLTGGYRTGPDQPAFYNPDPEIHPTAIDIFYCIDGAATIVTGGTITNMKKRGRNRMAGARVEQGRADQMTKGDWLLVPSGTPHLHTEYPKPFGFYRYLLVKVEESDSIGTLP